MILQIDNTTMSYNGIHYSIGIICPRQSANVTNNDHVECHELFCSL